MANDVEHFYIPIAVCIFSLVEYIFTSLAHFLTGLFAFFTIQFKAFFVYTKY